MKIAEIKEILKNASMKELPERILEFESDERAGVIQLVNAAKKRQSDFEREVRRTYEMKAYERKYKNCRYICGIDEVGRGPLAGPVVAAAVVLPKDVDIYYLNDSKQLSEKKRETLYDEIMETAIAVGIGFADEKMIDERNILQADYAAMRIALSKLSVTPDILLNDAVTIPEVSIPQIPIVKGDAKSVSIAAASIVAKVTRDRFMVEMDACYPGYDFAGNKGYGTARHIAQIKAVGPCEIHRKTFIKNLWEEGLH